jgi:TPR repeat protein
MLALAANVAMLAPEQLRAQPAATPTPAAPAAIAEDRSAARAILVEADRLRDGRAGKADHLRARELYERAAATGDPLANVQLAELVHRGVLGYRADPERAAALVQPHLAELERLAIAGDAKAQQLAGIVVYLGIAFDADPTAGARWFDLGTRAGSTESAVWLGWMRATGTGVDTDPAEAMRLYRAAADAGSCQAKYEMGYRSLLGQGLTEDRASGERWLREAATCRYPGAMADLGWYLVEGKVVQRNVQEGMDLMVAAKLAGFPAAANNLGWLAMRGTVVERDPAVALAYLLDALEGGAPGAPTNLYDLFTEQRFERSAMEPALARIRTVADSGYVPAMALLGTMYYWGSGVPRDFAQGLDWSRRAADRGSEWSMRTLGHAHAYGMGVPQDGKQAIAMLRRAHTLGDGGAGYFLGLVYLDGLGVEKDVPAALKALESSGERGFFLAVKLLAQLYDNAYRGVERDQQEALYWYRKLAEMGDTEAVGRIRFLELTAGDRKP